MGSSEQPLYKLPLVLVLIGLIGYLVSSYWYQRQEFQAVRDDLEGVRKTLSEQIRILTEQTNQRAMAMIRMSEDMTSLQSQMSELEKSLKTEQTERAQAAVSLQGNINKLQSQQQDFVTNLTKVEMQVKEVKESQLALSGTAASIRKVQVDIEGLKRQIELQAGKLISIQEQILVRTAPPTPAPSPTP